MGPRRELVLRRPVTKESSWQRSTSKQAWRPPRHGAPSTTVRPRTTPTGQRRRDLLEAHKRDVLARQQEIAGYLKTIDHKIEIYQSMVKELDGELVTARADRSTS